MGFILKEEFTNEINQACTQAVSKLQTLGYNSKVGTRNGVNYPSIIKGRWRAFLLLDTGMGWTCPLMEAINRPHWDWFLAQNVDMVNTSLLSGLPYALMWEPKSVDLIVDTLQYIIEDPCLIPNAEGSKEFKCPNCESDWDAEQREEGVVGRLFLHDWAFAEPRPEDFPPRWTEERLQELFGKKNFAK